MSRDDPYRQLATRDLLAAIEALRWYAADIATDPGDWQFPAGTAAFIAARLDAAETELARRQRLRAHPLAPAWPDARADLDAVKAAIDLPALIERYAPVAFRKRGKRLVAPCPRHGGTSGAGFTVDPAKQLWYCFGCAVGGDAISFVEWHLDLLPADAIAFCKREAGIDIDSPRSRPPKGIAGGNHRRPRPCFEFRGGQVVRR